MGLIRNRRTKSAPGMLAATVVVAALAAGCQSAVNTPAAGPSPVKGGTLVVAQNADAQPAQVQAGRAGNYPWVLNVFETLTQYDKNLKPQPLLATKWELAADKLSMKITLRDDVTFHTGRKMTADDVKFSFEYAGQPNNATQLAFIAKQISSIDVGGPTDLTLHFSKPLSNIFDFFDQTVIVDKETVSGLADGSKVVGTGPFSWKSWQPGGKIVLKKYAGYRDAKDVYLDGVEFPIITDSTAQISALRSGAAQVASGLSITDALGFDKNPQFALARSGGTIYPLGLNTAGKPFDDVRVRQAVGYAIDRKRINDQVFGGQGTLTDLFWSPNEAGYDKELAGRYTYDPQKAKQLVSDAGAAGASVPIVVPAIPAVQSEFEIVRNNLAAIGLDAKAVSLSVTEFDAKQVAGDLGPAFLLLHGQVGYSAATLISSLPSLRKGNPSHFFPVDYEKLRSDLEAASTDDQRAQAVKALSAYMLDQAFSLPLVQAPNIYVSSTKAQGVTYSPRGAVIATHAYVSK